MGETMNQNFPGAPPDAAPVRVVRPPGAVAAYFAQIIVQTSIGEMEQPLPAPASGPIELNFFVNLLVLVAPAIASEKPQHFVAAPGAVPDFLAPKKIATADPVPLKLR